MPLSHFVDHITDELIDLATERTHILPGEFSSAFLEPRGGAVNRVAVAATAYPHRRLFVRLSSGWRDPAEDAAQYRLDSLLSRRARAPCHRRGLLQLHGSRRGRAGEERLWRQFRPAAADQARCDPHSVQGQPEHSAGRSRLIDSLRMQGAGCAVRLGLGCGGSLWPTVPRSSFTSGAERRTSRSASTGRQSASSSCSYSRARPSRCCSSLRAWRRFQTDQTTRPPRAVARKARRRG